MITGLALLFALQPVVTPLPGERHGHRVERVGDHLVVFGGFDERSDASNDRGMRDTLILDMRSGTWRKGPPMATPRAFFGSAVLPSGVHAIGEGVERLDSDFSRWVRMEEPALIKSHFGALAHNGRILTVGGYPVEAARPAEEDRSFLSAISPPEMTQGEHFHLLAKLRGEIHVFGGYHGQRFEPMRQHWRLGPKGWVRAKRPPVPLWAKFAAYGVHGNSFYVFTEHAALRYDAKNDQWLPRKPMPLRLAMPASIVIGDKLYVLGGLAEPRKNVFLAYDIPGDRWTDLSPSG